MGSYSGCQGLLASLREKSIIRMQDKAQMQEHALDFQVWSFFAAFFDFFLVSTALCLTLARWAVVTRLLVSAS
jgi:hypothetical protein